MSRRTLTAVVIGAGVFIAVRLALMAAVMAGAFGLLGHFPFGGAFAVSPLAWALTIVAMALGWIGLPWAHLRAHPALDPCGRCALLMQVSP